MEMRNELGREAAERRPGRKERVRYAKGRYANLVAMLGLAGAPPAPQHDRAWAILRLDRMLARIAAYGPRPVVALLRFPDHARPDLIDDCGEMFEYAVRTRDWIARWDSHTYVIVLDARIDHAIKALERVRDAAHAVFEEAHAPDGVSIGIALSRRDERAQDVIERARHALADAPAHTKLEL